MRDASISTGFTDGTYRPSASVTRQAMSAFMARLSGATAAVLADPALRARLGELGLAPRPATPPAAVKEAVHAEISRWSGVIERAGIERQ